MTAADLSLEITTGLGLAREAGRQIQRQFGRHRITAQKTSSHDLLTSTDLEVERFLRDGLRDVFPTDTIEGEELGVEFEGTSRRRWRLDPIDGTHNFVLGMPAVGVLIELRDDRGTVLVIGHDPLGDRSVVISDVGIHRWTGSEPAQPPHASTGQPSREPIAAIQKGYSIRNDDPLLVALRAHLAGPSGRVVEHWCPTLDLILLAEGSIDVLAALACEGNEQSALLFALGHLGYRVIELRPGGTSGPPWSFVAAHPRLADGVIERLDHAAEIR